VQQVVLKLRIALCTGISRLHCDLNLFTLVLKQQKMEPDFGKVYKIMTTRSSLTMVPFSAFFHLPHE